jgi:thiamine-monophosphate kinase
LAISEFELIKQYFDQTNVEGRRGIVKGIGDDAAIVAAPTGHQIAISIDTLVRGVQFPADISPADLAYRALAVNLSDLAASGATPWWFTLALTLPSSDETWLQNFSRGLFEIAANARIDLVGGDTTKGPLAVTIQVAGIVPTGKALMRSGAEIGDKIYCTGTLGDGCGGLQCWQKKFVGADADYLKTRFVRPQPRLIESSLLLGLANSCVDVSDGLLADLAHIIAASKVGADIDITQVPVSSPLFNQFGETALEHALAGGDDYELCFTVSPHKADMVESAFAKQSLRLTHIGHITEGSELRCISPDGSLYTLPKSGYQHF